MLHLATIWVFFFDFYADLFLLIVYIMFYLYHIAFLTSFEYILF